MCNAWNHPLGCTCGFGGEGHRGVRSSGTYQTPFSSFHLETSNSISIDPYVNPNARCPVCGQHVFFYESPHGGKVFFDELGPPWPKHPCTDRPGAYHFFESFPILRKKRSPKTVFHWQRTGWAPCICTEMIPLEDSLRLKVKIVETGIFLCLHSLDVQYDLLLVPMTVRPISKRAGRYLLSTFNLHANGRSLPQDVYFSAYKDIGDLCTEHWIGYPDIFPLVRWFLEYTDLPAGQFRLNSDTWISNPEDWYADLHHCIRQGPACSGSQRDSLRETLTQLKKVSTERVFG